jgi:CheY-like chemotaxis protein
MERLLHSAVVVSQHPHVRRLIETNPDTEPCDVVFVESPAHAYSLIKRVAPAVVIFCLEMNDCDSFRVLSMLLLDSRTREIPVVIRMMQARVEESAHSSCEDEHDCGVTLIHHTIPMN